MHARRKRRKNREAEVIAMKSLPRKRTERDAFWNEKDVASFTEATGLVPALPAEPRSRYNLLALYAIHSMPTWDGRQH